MVVLPLSRKDGHIENKAKAVSAKLFGLYFKVQLCISVFVTHTKDNFPAISSHHNVSSKFIIKMSHQNVS